MRRVLCTKAYGNARVVCALLAQTCASLTHASPDGEL